MAYEKFPSQTGQNWPVSTQYQTHPSAAVGVPVSPQYATFPEGFTPLSLGDSLVAWWDADHVVNTSGRASSLTALKGPDLPEGSGAAGPTIEATRWQGGTAALRFAASKYFQTTDATILAVASGTSKTHEVWHIIQPLSINAGNIHMFADSTAGDANPQDGVDSSANSFRAILRSDAGGAVTVTYNAQRQQRHTFGVHCLEFRGNGTARQMSKDGVAEAQTNTGALAITTHNNFCIGALHQNGVLTANCVMLWKATFLINGNLTADQRAQLRLWVANNYGLKFSGLGATGPTRCLVFPMAPGQSNDRGAATTAPPANTDSRITILHRSGFYETPGTEPTDDSTNNVYASYPPANLYSFGWRFAQRLLELDSTIGEIVLVNCSVGATDTSATALTGWSASLTTDPPASNSLIGMTKLQVREALKRPNAKIGAFLNYLGENNAQDATEAANYATELPAIWDELLGEPEFSSSFEKTTRFVQVRLPVAAPTVGDYSDWAGVQTSQDTVDAARADAILVQAPAATLDNNLHLDTGADDTAGLRKLGKDIADAWFAAS